MIFKQNYLSLKSEIENQKKNGSWGLIQKAFSSPHFVILKMRRPGQTYCIYIGRGGDYQGITFQNENIQSEFRIIDSFLEYVRKQLVGTRIHDIAVDDSDRIVHIGYSKGVSEGLFSLFWKGPQLLLINSVKSEASSTRLLSWKKGTFTIPAEEGHSLINVHQKYFDEMGRKVLESRSTRLKVFDWNEYQKFAQGLLSNNKVQSKIQKKLLRKAANIRKDLEKVSGWKLLDAELKVADLENISVLKVGKIRIDFKGIKGHYKKRDRAYEKLKGFKRGELILLDRLKKINQDIEDHNSHRGVFDISHVKVLNPLTKNQKENAEVKSNYDGSDYLTYVLNKSNIKMYFGKSARGNDYIRKTFAHKMDWWVHIDGYPGGHCIMKSHDRPQSEELEVIGSILRDMGSLQIGIIPLLICQVKNLKGVKGVPGKVNFKNEKRININYDKIWIEKVK